LSQLGVELPAFGGHPFKKSIYTKMPIYNDSKCRCGPWKAMGTIASIKVIGKGLRNHLSV